jgi:hypothetical protein
MAVQAAASAGTSVAGGAGTIAAADGTAQISVATRVTVAAVVIAAVLTVMSRSTGGAISGMSPVFDDIVSPEPSLSPSLYALSVALYIALSVALSVTCFVDESHDPIERAAKANFQPHYRSGTNVNLSIRLDSRSNQ